MKEVITEETQSAWHLNFAAQAGDELWITCYSVAKAGNVATATS